MRSTSGAFASTRATRSDRKSTRLNSSHSQISYAVFCLKKKTQVRYRRRVPGGMQRCPTRGKRAAPVILMCILRSELVARDLPDVAQVYVEYSTRGKRRQ